MDLISKNNIETYNTNLMKKTSDTFNIICSTAHDYLSNDVF